MSEKIYKFNKKDCWDAESFYEVRKNKDGKKELVLLFGTDRVRGDNSYDSWAYKEYEDGLLLGTIEELTEWGDILYGIESKGINIFDKSGYVVYDSPQPVYDKVNSMLEKWGGCSLLTIFNINEDTPCGYYYG